MEENTNSDQNYKGVALAAWIIIGVTCFIALIPAIGLLTWFIAIPVLLATFVLGIIAITKGGTLQGVLILLVSLIIAPAYLLIAPMASTFIFAMVFGERQGEYQTERGRIYYFSDGVIAIDTTVTPHRFHIYAIHPKGRKIEKVELIEDGIEISGRGVGEGAKGRKSSLMQRKWQPVSVDLMFLARCTLLWSRSTKMASSSLALGT